MRDVRNQGVLMRGVNDTVEQLLDLCFTLLDGAGIMPYYFYMCDMIPNSEHWRVRVKQAQELQHAIMGYLPGFATPRIVCDVPFVGKRWVHQVRLLRPGARHLGLDQELPHLDRGRRPRRDRPDLPVLRPDRHPAGRGPGWWTEHGMESVERTLAEAAAAAAASRGAAAAQHAAH